MKILIWVHKNDVMANKILTYHFTRPIIDRHDEYVQVILTHDEFIQLEDRIQSILNENKELNKELDREADWLINQYNRNRGNEDQISNVDDIDQNNQPFGD